MHFRHPKPKSTTKSSSTLRSTETFPLHLSTLFLALNCTEPRSTQVSKGRLFALKAGKKRARRAYTKDMESLELLRGFSLQRPLALSPRTTRVGRPPNWSTPKVEMPAVVSGRRQGWLCRGAVDAAGSVGGEVFSLTSSSKSDVDYLGESTKGDLNVKKEHLEALGMDGQATLGGPIEEIARIEAEEAKKLLNVLEISVNI